MKPLIAASLLVCVVQSAENQPPGDLTAVESKTVLGLAENALRAQDLWKGKVFLTNTEVVVDHNADPPLRYALLTFYRYDGNLAILLLVSLEKMTVTKVTTHPHMPTSLAKEEIAEAQKIANGHPDIQKALTRYKHLDKIEIDTIVAQIIKPDVPGYHHRVARLFFRDGERNYLVGVPMVDVDLTTGEVRFDLIRGMHAKK
jgi:Cu2+-containing amine oxidase